MASAALGRGRRSQVRREVAHSRRTQGKDHAARQCALSTAPRNAAPLLLRRRVFVPAAGRSARRVPRSPGRSHWRRRHGGGHRGTARAEPARAGGGGGGARGLFRALFRGGASAVRVIRPNHHEWHSTLVATDERGGVPARVRAHGRAQAHGASRQVRARGGDGERQLSPPPSWPLRAHQLGSLALTGPLPPNTHAGWRWATPRATPAPAPTRATRACSRATSRSSCATGASS